MRCALVFISIIIDLHLITLICTKLLSMSSYITIKMYFFDRIQRGSVACGKVKRDTVRFIFNLEQDPTPPPPHTHTLFNFRRIVYVYEFFST